MNKDLLEKYAKLIVKVGINVQKNQTVVVSSPIECAYFTRILSEAAYREGAREVVIRWNDELSAKIRYQLGADEIFDEFPEWQKEFYMFYVQQGAAFINISAEDPELLKDVDVSRVVRVQKASNSALKDYRERLMSNKNVWCVVSVPTKAWAQKVFPDLSEDDATAKLWEAILKAVRVDNNDPVAAWEKHKADLKNRMDFLNSRHFRYLQYKNSLGTDLTVELPEEHIWLGGSEYSAGGVEFIANMPTEEVFTLPKKNGINGRVVSSKPLNYNGNLIEDFSLTFKDGKIVEYSAKKGIDVLKNLIDTDEGARYLGEVALVPQNSPISNLNILFYNTLFDENASCHFAIGKAYPVCIKGGAELTKDKLLEIGVNDSLVHEDFMIGTDDLEITGITVSGEKIPIFINGNFVI